jgi:hypothetical protein
MNIFEKDIRMYDLLGRVVPVKISKISAQSAKINVAMLTPWHVPDPYSGC